MLVERSGMIWKGDNSQFRRLQAKASHLLQQRLRPGHLSNLRFDQQHQCNTKLDQRLPFNLSLCKDCHPLHKYNNIQTSRLLM